MQEVLSVGVVAKPQGITGEIKVIPYNEDLKRFKSIKEVVIDGATVKIEKVRGTDKEIIVKLFGVNDRNSAELLRGKTLSVRRENLMPLDKNSFYIVDLIGSSVVLDDGVKVGVITDVDNAKTDVITVKDNSGKTLCFPFLKDLLISFSEGVLTLNAKRFSEVACYED